MNPALPIPDPIPAPAPFFHLLELIFFGLHILLINVLLGGTLISLVSRIWKPLPSPRVAGAGIFKLPVIFALAVNMGVATLLFLQVLYGHLFYVSSVLMGTYWILIIPTIILAYYASYTGAHSASRVVQAFVLAFSSLAFLSIASMLVINMLTMLRPDTWGTYFADRTGAILKVPDPTFLPRYLHFLSASVAIGGLFLAGVWSSRKKRGVEGSDAMVVRGLAVFGYATMVQIAVGIWFLLSLRQEYIEQFIGRNVVATISLWLGFLCGIGAAASAFARQFRPAVVMVGITIVAMVIVRDALRSMYLGSAFDPSTLTVAPQYDILVVFLAVFLVGIAVVSWMIRTGFRAPSGRIAP